jgi:hypothetical protein
MTDTRVSLASTISPQRFSISPWPMKHNLASIPRPSMSGWLGFLIIIIINGQWDCPASAPMRQIG